MRCFSVNVFVSCYVFPHDSKNENIHENNGTKMWPNVVISYKELIPTYGLVAQINTLNFNLFLEVASKMLTSCDQVCRKMACIAQAS